MFPVGPPGPSIMFGFYLLISEPGFHCVAGADLKLQITPPDPLKQGILVLQTFVSSTSE